MRPPFHVPTRSGLAALNELRSVPWNILHHAYGRGVTGTGIHDDVARSLRGLADDPEEALDAGLSSNICHQGTVYEATAYAVPFLAAVAAGDVERGLRGQLVHMLGYIALVARFATDNGSRSGAFGDGVDKLIRDALTVCDSHLRAIAAADPELTELVGAMRATVSDPTRTAYDALRDALGEDEDEDD